MYPKNYVGAYLKGILALSGFSQKYIEDLAEAEEGQLGRVLRGEELPVRLWPRLQRILGVPPLWRLLMSCAELRKRWRVLDILERHFLAECPKPLFDDEGDIAVRLCCFEVIRRIEKGGAAAAGLTGPKAQLKAKQLEELFRQEVQKTLKQEVRFTALEPEEGFDWWQLLQNE